MSDVTGAVHEKINGEAYTLRLTMGGIAKLQALHGQNVAGLLDGTAGNMPNFSALLDLVSEALQKGSDLDKAAADELADELVTADLGVIERVIKAAFPSANVEVSGPGGAAPGNGTGPKAAA